jgi:hypothetical protein
MTATKYSVFEYLYRDAGNYKAWGELLLLGDLSEADMAAINSRFESGQYFIAEQLGIPSLYEKLWKECDSNASDDDHVWHEFQAVRPATDHEIDTLPVWGSAASLIDKVSGVERWDERLSRNWDLNGVWK